MGEAAINNNTTAAHQPAAKNAKHAPRTRTLACLCARVLTATTRRLAVALLIISANVFHCAPCPCQRGRAGDLAQVEVRAGAGCAVRPAL